MIEIAFTLLHELASSIVNELFVGPVKDRVKNSIVGMRARNAQNRAITRFIESLEPFFSNELNESDTLFVASNLKSRFDGIRLTPKLLAEHRFNLDALASSIIQAHTQQGAPPHLTALLDDMTREALVVARAMADILPEWEGVAWRENFKAFEELQAKLDLQNEYLKAVLDDPTNRMQSFETEFRRHVISELQRVYLKGVGNIGDTRALSIDSLFTHVRVKPALATPQEVSADSSNPAASASRSGSRHMTPSDPVEIETALGDARRMVIMGAPGAGKSTAVQFIALRAALGEGFFAAEHGQTTVPFLLRVRSFEDFDRLPGPKDIVVMCAPLLDRSDAGDFVADMLRTGRALLIIDGLDECEIVDRHKLDVGGEPSSERDRVIRWIERLADTYPDCRLITTTRPVGYRNGDLKKAGFREYEIMPLNDKQQEKFIERWCQAVELSLNPDDPASALIRADKVAIDLKRRIASARSVRALAYNPLMLSVICILHRYRGERLPERRVDLLNDCVNVLLYDFRSAQGLKTSIIGDLDAKELRSLLEPLAWHMALDGADQASEDTLRDLFSRHLPEIDQPEHRASEIIATIRDRSGVIVENGPRSYSFMHLLFQEYLAAEECAARAANYDVLLSKVSDPRWKEIIPMAVAASSANRETLLRSLLQVDAVPLAASALAMIDRASTAIRREVSEALDRYVGRLCEEFDKDLLTRIVAIGTVDSARVLLKLVASLPVATQLQVHQAAETFDYGESKIEMSQFAEWTALRALTWNAFDLGEGLGNLRDIGYRSETSDPPRGGSWFALSLGLMTDIDAPEKSLSFDPIYNYAVMLDTGDAYRGNLVGLIWDAFEALPPETFRGIESRLLTLHLVWYFSIAEERIDNLLDYLDSIPADACPAFQLGILNNAMGQLTPGAVAQFRARAEARWRLVLGEAETQILDLFPVWKDSFEIEDGEPVPAPIEVLTERFSREFREHIEKRELFPRIG